MVERNSISKSLFLQIEQDFKVPMFDVDPKTLPETDSEMELYMQLNYKPGIDS